MPGQQLAWSLLLQLVETCFWTTVKGQSSYTTCKLLPDGRALFTVLLSLKDYHAHYNLARTKDPHSHVAQRNVPENSMFFMSPSSHPDCGAGLKVLTTKRLIQQKCFSPGFFCCTRITWAGCTLQNRVIVPQAEEKPCTAQLSGCVQDTL